jgi:ribosomal protein S18 acetylase RimI-like enzyme
MAIRAAVAADVDAIAQVHVRAWQSAYRGQIPDAYLDSLDPSKRATMWSGAIRGPSSQVFVAMQGEALVGFCSVMPSRDSDAGADVAEITAIYVDPTYWRSGLGTCLVEAAVEYTGQRRFKEVTLWVLAANVSARAFYEARGFIADGVTKTEERPGFSLCEVRYRRMIAM